MIRPSPELEAVCGRWIDALADCDAQRLTSLLSTNEALLYCGTADGEIWKGDFFRRTYASHVAEAPKGSSIVSGEVTAFENGSVGWAFWNGSFRVPRTERDVQVRITMIFGLEQAVWKIVHIHASNPTSNVDSYGWVHHALDDLLLAARGSNLHIGRSGSAAVMFTDVVDSSALLDSMGDRLWTERIDAHLAHVQEIVETNGGTLVKSLGDGTMSTFTSPLNALTAAHNIQSKAQVDKTEPRLHLRIGLHTGEVIENKGDFFGTVVNKAARIAAMAGPDEIRLSDATRMMVGADTSLIFSDPVTAHLKGLEGEHTLYRLAWRP